MILNTLRKSVGRGNTTLARNNYKAFTCFRPENKTFSPDLQEEIKDTRMNAKMRHFSTTTKDSEESGMPSRQLSRSSSPFVRSLSRSDSFIENQTKTLHPMEREKSRHEIPVEKQAGLGQRMLSTVEVMVSKIFPAGFGWQGASCVAEDLGFSATDMSFFLTTGAGDFLGVATGHTLYYSLKKAITGDEDINMTYEFHTGLLLGSAAFCSGTVWQPIVNFAQMQGMGFNSSALLTLGVCGGAFFGGLRLFRVLYSPIMEGVEATSYENLKNDFALSVSIGAATACFVGTDVSYGDANWLRPVVGIEDSFSVPLGMCLAGSSTALGFFALQTVQNVVVPEGKNWID